MADKPAYEELEQRVRELEKAVTEHKRTEKQLQRKESLLNATQQLAKIGGWEIDLEKQITFWTNEVYRIHDLQQDRFTSKEKDGVYRPHDHQSDEFTSTDEAVVTEYGMLRS